MNELQASPCFCVGPQNGEPRCPCQMRHVKVQNGRYILPEQDLGPVIPSFKEQLEALKNE